MVYADAQTLKRASPHQQHPNRSSFYPTNLPHCFDGLPAQCPDHGDYMVHGTMPTSQIPTSWCGLPSSMSSYEYESDSCLPFYDFPPSQTGPPHDTPLGESLDYGCNIISQSWPQPYDPSILPTDPEQDVYEPSAYLLDPHEQDIHMIKWDRFTNDSAYLQRAQPEAFSRLSISQSPKTLPSAATSMSRMFPAAASPPEMTLTSSRASDDDCDDEVFDDGSGEDDKECNMDEPYAKLIYRALMAAPNNAMVLKDIYKWFAENTDKASSPSKGWQNSIRHNLSMNGVSHIIHGLSLIILLR